MNTTDKDLLTGKAKQDFFDYLKSDPLMIVSRLGVSAFLDLPYCMQLAYRVQWFDSVQIYIIIEVIPIMNSAPAFKPSILGDKSNNFCFETRQEALKQAIITANTIYNEQSN
jgi:hypothetical protein